MKRYIIKETSVATPENQNFAGQTAIYYIGKGGSWLGKEGSYAEASHSVEPLKDWLLEEYGYSRKCDAARNWSYKNPENTKWWSSTAEILEFEV